VDLSDRDGECPCRYYDEMGFSCVQIKALLLAINHTSTWCSRCFHIAIYKESYLATIPAMTLSGCLTAGETFFPPDYKHPAGRPPKKRKDRSWLQSTKVHRHCKACGGNGPFAKGCQAPNTQYRYESHKTKALSWCRMIENSQLA
jgi:hypothetical protein